MSSWRFHADFVAMQDGASLNLPGLHLQVIKIPGHTSRARDYVFIILPDERTENLQNLQ